MRKTLKRTGKIVIVIGILSLLFFFINRENVQKHIIVHSTVLTNINSEKVKASDVTKVNTTDKTTNSNSCASITAPTLEEKTGSWQPVDNGTTAFIFSAYLIHERRKIVIIGMKDFKSVSYFCQFWTKEGNNKITLIYETRANHVRLPEGHGQPYYTSLFECSLNNSYSSIPTYVSMVDRSCIAPMNILYVQHVTKPKAAGRNFTVCLSLLYGNPSIYRLVEWIEFNIILGADKFVIYNYTDNAKVNEVLRYYAKKGLLTVIPWNLPESGNEAGNRKPISVHYFGQVASLNDCLYRNKYESEFVVNCDLDEFIIPHSENDTTWWEMLTRIDKNKAAYNIRNTFFKVEWNNSNVVIANKTLVDKFQLITMQKLQHEKKIFSHGLRSKYFARTSDVHSLMIHTVNGKNSFQVPIDVALLHHYRDFETKNDLDSSKILDRTVPDKFGNVLIENVKAVWSELNNTSLVNL